MNKEDYFKYYIQGSDHYLIPKDVFDELFYEMESWKEDTQKYKEVIDKAIEYINENKDKYYQDWGQDESCIDTYLSEDEIKQLLKILKEVE